MREVDLDLFDFDYDLTWMGFFLDSRGSVLGRYGGRDADSAESRVSLAGLRYAMERALERHRQNKAKLVTYQRRPRTVMEYSAAKQLAPRACVHCHQVYDLRRESMLTEGTWSREELWVYPLPENLGLTLDVDQGDRVVRVTANSAMEQVGLQAGDRLLAVNEMTIASIADVQYALHRAPTTGSVAMAWQRGSEQKRGEARLLPGWKETDLSWRWSLRGVDPPTWVHGPDLSANEKKQLGLAPNQLALEQSQYLSQPARQAGIRQGDIILGINGKLLQMTARQFGAYVRLNFAPGERVEYNILRDGKRIDIPITLRGRR